MKKVVLIALVLGASVFITACDSPEQKAAETPASLSVEAISPQTQNWEIKVNSYGPVEAWQYVSINSEVSGARLLELYAEVGDYVDENAILAAVDDKNAAIELQQAQALLKEHQANLSLANAQLQRYQSLSQQQSVSDDQLMQAEVAVKKNDALVMSSKANVDAAQLALTRTQVRAPTAGIVVERNVQVGDVLPTSTVLYTLVRDGRLEWRAQVTAEQLISIEPGQAVSIYLSGDTVVSGSVRKTGKSLDEDSLLGTVYVDLPAHNALRAGMYVEGDIHVGNAATLSIPESAVLFRDGNSYVMLIEKQGKVKQQQIDTGRHAHGRVEVLAGLSVSNRIVKQGASFLRNGETVRVVNTNAVEEPAL